MDAFISEWSNLLVRWVHVIAGIMWIGDSLLFNWMDRAFQPPEEKEAGVEGELWMIHGGGFFQLRKRKLQPNQMPKVVHWFKWEAAITWLSGYLLLWIVYYFGGVLLEESSQLGLGAAIAIATAFIVGSFLIYDQAWKLPLPQSAVLAILVVLLLGDIYALTQVFSARAAYLHVGAILGTCMVANVWMHIIPNQRAMFKATAEGVAPDTRLGAKAKLRSRHNNYLTYPVIFIMISHHFPSTFGSRWNWMVLWLVFIFGASFRHILNTENRCSRGFWILSALSLVLLLYLSSPWAP